ncbi:hypothetical protein LTR17_023930 [Elasticomyces elasticus]|nr:hypothetical protein LTR17_023930 [Elasticomyces elasticus]
MTTTSRLLDLPPELRNRIFEDVLAELDTVISVGSSTRLPYDPCNEDPQWRKAKLPHVTAVSRQIRYETLSLYYGTKIFEVHLDYGLNSNQSGLTCLLRALNGAALWLHRMGAQQKAMVKNLVLSMIMREDQDGLTLSRTSPRYVVTRDDVSLGLRIGEKATPDLPHTNEPARLTSPWAQRILSQLHRQNIRPPMVLPEATPLGPTRRCFPVHFEEVRDTKEG